MTGQYHEKQSEVAEKSFLNHPFMASAPAAEQPVTEALPRNGSSAALQEDFSPPEPDSPPVLITITGRDGTARQPASGSVSATPKVASGSDPSATACSSGSAVPATACSVGSAHGATAVSVRSAVPATACSSGSAHGATARFTGSAHSATSVSVRSAHGATAGEKLHGYIERIKRLEDERKTIAGDMQEVCSDARVLGFDTTVIRRMIALRRRDDQKRIERDELIEIYRQTLGKA